MFKLTESEKKNVCTGFREYEAFSEETLLKLAYIRYFQRPNLVVWPKNISHSRFWRFLPGNRAQKSGFVSVSSSISRSKPPKSRVWNTFRPNHQIWTLEITYVCEFTGFLPKMIHILGNLCTLVFSLWTFFSQLWSRSAMNPGRDRGFSEIFLSLIDSISELRWTFSNFLIFLEAEP